MLTQVVDKIAAIVNMLERIEKVRSKKDLYWLGEQLAIMLKPDMSLKDMKKQILKESRTMPELEQAIKEHNDNSDKAH